MSSSRTIDQPQALAEGRRIYLGNLSYLVKPMEIEEMLKKSGFDDYEHIHMSIDPVSAKNPSYCFIDFRDRGDAQRALSNLNAQIRGRPVRVGPCEPKRQHQGRWQSDQKPIFDRWGDWSGKRNLTETVDNRMSFGKIDERGIEKGPDGAIKHFNDIAATNPSGRRVRVQGLTKMIDQKHNNDEICEIFAGFNPLVISKRIAPDDSERGLPGNHHHCFVDFSTPREAASAVHLVNARRSKDSTVRVKLARPVPEKLLQRMNPANWSPSGIPSSELSQSPARHISSWRRPDSSSSADASRQSSRVLASSDWRQRA